MQARANLVTVRHSQKPIFHVVCVYARDLKKINQRKMKCPRQICRGHFDMALLNDVQFTFCLAQQFSITRNIALSDNAAFSWLAVSFCVDDPAIFLA